MASADALVGTSSNATSGALGLMSEKSSVTMHDSRRPVTVQAAPAFRFECGGAALPLAAAGGADGGGGGGSLGEADEAALDVVASAEEPLWGPQHAGWEAADGACHFDGDAAQG